MKILIIVPYFPYPIKSGGHSRVFNMIKNLSQQHEIDFISLVFNEDLPHINTLKKYCSNVYYVNIDEILNHKVSVVKRNNFKRLLQRVFLFLKGVPLEASGFYFKELQKLVTKILNENNYQVLQIEYPRMVLNLNQSLFQKQKAVKIIIEHDLSFITQYRKFQKEKSLPKRLFYFIDYYMNFKFACKIWRKFDHVVVMSEVDKNKIEQYLPGQILHVVPNGVDITEYQYVQSRDEKKQIILLGGAGHPANIDAYRYFVESIYPTVKKEIKNISLLVIGSRWEQFAEENRDPTIEFTGFVEDISQYVSKNSILAAPILIGGGTRLKILEAMALGLPVISTVVGSEGIDVKDKESIMHFENAGEFSDKLKLLYNNHDLKIMITRRARAIATDKYSWTYLAKKMDHIYRGKE